MDFRLLGPLDVRDDERSLALGGPRRRALLAMLLVHANEVVSIDRLSDAVWDERPPGRAEKTIQVHVSRLRRALGPDRVLTRTPGYVLRVEELETDAARFERLVATAGSGPQEAATRLRAALALWRGQPLADVADHEFARAEIARLTELRLVALEARVDADMELGRHAELVGELDGLVRDHPLREHLRACRMLCLYRSGRQADALDAYRDARSALVQELGIEPGRELRELHAAILHQDPSLELTSRLQGTSAAFVGRVAELDRLRGALDGAREGRARVVLLSGEPGIGKSRLVEELCALAVDAGFRVAEGRCWEAGGAPAYWPWVQSLRTYVRDLDDEDAHAVADLDVLARLVPDLPAELEGTRVRLFDAVCALLRTGSAQRPLVLVLEDLHAADEPSLLLLRYVARELGDAAVLVLATLRDVDPTPRDPVSAAVADLARRPGVEELTLGGLEVADAAAYLAATIADQAVEVDAAAIHARTGGNPFYLVEVVRLLQDGRDEAIPPGVRAVVRERLRRLPATCRDILAAASVLGRDVALDDVAGMCGLDLPALLDALDPALAQRVLTEVPGAYGRLRFGHTLVRDAVYEELTATRRMALHARAARVLEARAGDRPAELALHFLAAGDTAAALVHTRAAGDRAAAQLAHEEAARLYGQALELAQDPPERADLLLAIGEMHGRAGDTRAAKDAFRAAAELATEHDLPARLAYAAVGYGGRILWNVSRDDPEMTELLERALAAIPADDSPTRVRLLVRLAGGPLRDASIPPRRRQEMSAEALAMARRLGDDATLAYGLHGYILGHHGPGHTPHQLALAAELIDVATRLGDRERLVDGLEEHMVAALELGDVAGARGDLERLTRVAAELRQPAQAWLAAVYQALFALLDRDDAASALVDAARAVGEDVLSWNARVTHLLQRYVLARDGSRPEDVLGDLRRAVEAFPTYAVLRCALAHVAAVAGRDELARSMLVTEPPVDEEWLVATCLLADAASVLGDDERSAALRRRLRPYADRLAVSPPEICVGPVAARL